LRQALGAGNHRALAQGHDAALIDELNRIITLQQHFAKAGYFEKSWAPTMTFTSACLRRPTSGNLGTVKSRSGHIDRLRRLHLPSPGKHRTSCASQLIVKAIAAGESEDAQRHLRKHLSARSDISTKSAARFRNIQDA